MRRPPPVTGRRTHGGGRKLGVVAVLAGVAADRVLGEPPTAWHPVAWFGSAMTALEHWLHADDHRRGVAYAAAGVALGAGAGLVVDRVIGRDLATAAATATAVAGRMLDAEALAIATLLEDGDLASARVALRSLVGRRADGLDAAEVTRAVIESVAENTVDAVTAAMWWAAVGGAPAVLTHRAVNTMDAMVGHRTPRYVRFGWASARLDDAANWLPARCTTAIVALGHGRRAPAVLRSVRQQAALHPSPNGGLIEAAFAHRLGITLGGTNRYGDHVEDRGQVGGGPAPTPSDIGRAVALRRATAVQAGGALLAADLLRRAASAGNRRARRRRG